MLKYKYIGKHEHNLAGVPGTIKPGVPFEVTKKQTEGLERYGREEYTPVIEDEAPPKQEAKAPAEPRPAKAPPKQTAD